jgi:hypothetical protein
LEEKKHTLANNNRIFFLGEEAFCTRALAEMIQHRAKGSFCFGALSCGLPGASLCGLLDTSITALPAGQMLLPLTEAERSNLSKYFAYVCSAFAKQLQCKN